MSKKDQILFMPDHCWTHIGVSGDRSCPTLETVIHCQNCSVYAQAGRGLLNRPAPVGYQDEWTTLLAQERQTRATTPDLSLTIFQLGREWLALPSNIFHQVLPPGPVHHLPHRSNPVLRGITNVRGQLLLCVSLHALLDVQGEGDISRERPSVELSGIEHLRHRDRTTRLVVIQRQQETWAFEVDALYGLHRCPPNTLREPPTSASKARHSLTRSILPWQGQNVSCLSDIDLFQTLQQQAL